MIFCILELLGGFGMYCDNCGAEVRNGAAFCPVCGNRINKQKKVVSKNIVVIIMIAIIAIIVGTIGVILVKKNTVVEQETLASEATVIEKQETAIEAASEHEEKKDDVYREYADDGTLLMEQFSNSDGSIVKEVYYTDGYVSKELLYSKDGYVQQETVYNSDGVVIKDSGFYGAEMPEYLNEYYDEGNLKYEARYNRNGALRFVHEYDERENLIKESQYNEDGTFDYSYGYEYFEDNSLMKMIYFDHEGNAQKEEVYKTVGGIRYIVEHNRENNTEIDVFYREDGSKIGKIAYEYDENGNITNMFQYSKNDAEPDYHYEYEYNESGDITNFYTYYSDIEEHVSYSYELDDQGKRIKHTYDDKWNEERLYDENDREIKCLAGDDVREYSYDENGNKIKEHSYHIWHSDTDVIQNEETIDYEYDKQGNLLIKRDTSDSKVTIEEYEYDYNLSEGGILKKYKKTYPDGGCDIGELIYDDSGNAVKYEEYSEWDGEKHVKKEMFYENNILTKSCRYMDNYETGERQVLIEERFYDNYGNCTKCIDYNSDDNYRSIGYVVTTDYDFYGGRDERQIDDKGENIRYVSRIPNRRGGLSLFDLMLK